MLMQTRRGGLEPPTSGLETCVLPTELTTHKDDYKRLNDPWVEITLQPYDQNVVLRGCFSYSIAKIE